MLKYKKNFDKITGFNYDNFLNIFSFENTKNRVVSMSERLYSFKATTRDGNRLLPTVSEMETNTEEIKEKRRVAKAAIFMLFCVLLERYSTAGISCKFCNWNKRFQLIKKYN